MSSLLEQTQSLLASHSKALSDAVALGHSLGVLASATDARITEAAAAAASAASVDGSAALAALTDAIGPDGALTQQLAQLHAQWAGVVAPAAAPISTAPAPVPDPAPAVASAL